MDWGVLYCACGDCIYLYVRVHIDSLFICVRVLYAAGAMCFYWCVCVCLWLCDGVCVECITKATVFLAL